MARTTTSPSKRGWPPPPLFWLAGPSVTLLKLPLLVLNVGIVVLLIVVLEKQLKLPSTRSPSAQPGDPSRYRAASAGPDEAWVPMVPADNADTPEADLWPAGKTGNVIRAMSLVPNEVRTLNDLSAVHYLPNVHVRDPSRFQGALSRPQMELIAGRVSALNGCLY